MSNDQRPKKMAVYSGDAAKAPPAAAARAGGPVSTGADGAVEAEGQAEHVDTADAAVSSTAGGLGMPIWGLLLFLMASVGGGGAAVALLPRLAPQLLHAA